MIKVYNSIFSLEQSKYIADGIFKKFAENATVKERNDYSNGAHGVYNLNEALDFVPFLQTIISKDYGTNIEFKNNYTRIYFNSNDLKIHTDRPDLDITLSVCLYSDIGFDWPIYISNTTVNTLWTNNLPIHDYISNASPYITPVGTGIACLGTKNPHWRNPLSCANDKKVVQAFYHWQYI